MADQTTIYAVLLNDGTWSGSFENEVLTLDLTEAIRLVEELPEPTSVDTPYRVMQVWQDGKLLHTKTLHKGNWEIVRA